MRLKLFLFFIGLFLFLGVKAQVNQGNKDYSSKVFNSSTNRHGNAMALKYGVKIGINFSNMSNGMTFNPNFSIGMGYHLGGFVNLHWGQRTVSSLPGTGLWGLQPELLFSSNLIKSDGGDVKLNYIKMPIMFKIYPLSALSLEIGPEFSYLISSSPKSMTVDGATIKLGDCKGLNFGVGVGASYEFNVGLMVGARYSMGFTDLGQNLKWKNNSNIQVMVGWLF